MQRKVNVVEDLDGNKIVVIHDIRFKGRQAIEWNNALYVDGEKESVIHYWVRLSL